MTECYACAKLAEIVAENSQLRVKVDELANGNDGETNVITSGSPLVGELPEGDAPSEFAEILMALAADCSCMGDGIVRHFEPKDVQGDVDALMRVVERDYVRRAVYDSLKELTTNSDKWLKGKLEEARAERDEWKAKAEQAERAMNKAAGNWCKADDKAGYWKSEVEECLKAARIESVSEGVMVYPRHEGYTAPSLLVKSQFDYLDQLCVDLQAKLDEMAERKCPGYEPESHHCRYHHQDFELNHQTVSRLKRENAELARDLGECMAERDELIAEIDALEYRGDLDEPRGTKVDINGEVLG